MNNTYGYARVSSRDQNEARQIIAFEEVGICKKHIYVDKKSGKNFDRPSYQKMLKKIQPGDLLIIKSIDRLGRNYDEIIDQWRYITKERRVDILVLDIPLLDTRNRGKDITGTFIADLVLQILSYVAQAEREAIKQRQAEGIAAAKARGVKFGRPVIQLPAEFESVCKDYSNHKLSVRCAAKRLSMSSSTFYRYYMNYMNEQLNEKKVDILKQLW